MTERGGMRPRIPPVVRRTVRRSAHEQADRRRASADRHHLRRLRVGQHRPAGGRHRRLQGGDRPLIHR
ncbi:hypothetical protein SBRY_100151 [Actinacidiphila bryophytorum]|uniref:Uncharacterized protein n=1 Tax=Actinacidiphila bryophytorum TaxID=1436133 RepID=A0A9W4E7L7_9ACTN|nr:hypothetical protein SBRY_100151 [Actinacidiphila bryophytorum]